MLIQIKTRNYFKLPIFIGFFLCKACVSEPVAVVRAHSARVTQDDLDEESLVLGLVGRDPAYILQPPGSTALGKRPLIAEVRLWKAGEDLTAAYVYDGEVTGEAVYTVVAEHLTLRQVMRRSGQRNAQLMGFGANLLRGFEHRNGDSFLSDVTFKMKRVIIPKGLGPKQASCPWTLFGGSKELFALESEPLQADAAQLLRVRVRNRALNQSEVDLIKGGLCTRLKQLDGKLLQPRVTYAMETDLAGELHTLNIEILEQLAFRNPKHKP